MSGPGMAKLPNGQAGVHLGTQLSLMPEGCNSYKSACCREPSHSQHRATSQMEQAASQHIITMPLVHPYTVVL
jgi:hypothetical protein